MGSHVRGAAVIMASMVFIGFSAIMFIVTYGILFLIAPLIFSGVFLALEDSSFIIPRAEYDTDCTGTVEPDNVTKCAFSGVYYENQEMVELLTPLMLTVGIFLLVVKVLMAASARGAD